MASIATFLVLALLLATDQGHRHPEIEQIRAKAEAAASPLYDEMSSYDRYQLWKVYVNDRKTYKQVFTSWRVNSSCIDILVHPDQGEKIKGELNQNNLKFDVNIKNLQTVIDQTATKEELSSSNDRKKHSMDWKIYHRLSTIYGYMYAMSQMHPDICTLTSIGQTAEKRQIKMLRINRGDERRKRIWLDGGMHAREWISPAAVTYIIDQIVLQYAHNQPNPLKEIDWYIVPVLNPDGYEYSHTTNRLWRKNRSRVKVGGSQNRCYGVDPNRNFGYQWSLELGTSRDPCSGVYRGPAPFSEAETAAVARFFINHPDDNNNWRGFISVHSYGQQIVYPWASRDLSGDQMDDELHATAVKAAQVVAKRTKSIYEVGPMGQVITGASGTSVDWARGSASIKYTFIVQTPDDGKFAFMLPHEMIPKAVQETYIIVESLVESIIADT